MQPRVSKFNYSHSSTEPAAQRYSPTPLATRRHQVQTNHRLLTSAEQHAGCNQNFLREALGIPKAFGREFLRKYGPWNAEWLLAV